jgi:DNA-binding NarL/FixJ family response regulator
MSAERCCMVIDAQPVVRLGIRHVLGSGWEVEELAHGADATELLTSVGPFQLAVVEMRAADGNGIPSGVSTVRALLRAQPGLGVVAHSDRTDGRAVREAVKAGAAAYVAKSSGPQSLSDAVDAAYGAESFIDPNVSKPASSGKTLTRRQRQILQMFADGGSTEDAARELGLSTDTVRTHAKASLPRLGARNRAHAIAIAMRNSMID